MATAAVRIFDLSLGQMLWSRRSLFLGLLVCGPILLAVLIRAVASIELVGLTRAGRPVAFNINGPTLYGMLIWLLFVRFAVPALGVFYGTALIADEVDDRTITYLFTRPIPRGAVLLGKYLAYLGCTVLLTLPAVVILYFVTIPVGGGRIGAAFPSLLADLGTLAVGLAVYGAVFALAGVRLKRPLVAGLVFAFGWEPAVLALPGYLKRLTVAYYLQGLVPHAMPSLPGSSILTRLFTEVPSVSVSVMSLVAITGATLWLAARAVERREYVLEQ